MLSVKTSPGRPAKLSGAALRNLKKQLTTRTGFGSYEEIQEWLAKEHQLETPYSTVHATVRYRLKAKLKASRPRSSEADPQVQDQFKKRRRPSRNHFRRSRAPSRLPAIIEVMVKYFSQERPVRYFCQDENRFGLKTLLGRRITLTGVKPTMPVQWQRDNFWTDNSQGRMQFAPRVLLYGAVEPATGEHFFYSFSHLDAACFGRFVELFGAAFPESLNLLHLDQASAHIATTFLWPDNVVPIFQPSHSPELNPIERVWQDLKKLFKNHNFPSLPALRQRVFEVVNSLTNTVLRSLTRWSYLLSATQLL